MAPGGIFASSGVNFGSLNILHTDALPLSETTLLPLFLNAETVAQMGGIKRLDTGRPPEANSGGKKEWVPFGRKDATEVFDALKGLTGLRELSVTSGEIGEDLVGMIAAVGVEVGLESLEIELRVGKDEDDATGDGLLWAEVLVSFHFSLPSLLHFVSSTHSFLLLYFWDPLASSLAPLALTLRALVVSDNRITNERTSLFHPNESSSTNPPTAAFDYLPTVLLFAKHLPKLTSVRWITRDGAENDEVARDQLWVACVGGRWMRLVG